MERVSQTQDPFSCLDLPQPGLAGGESDPADATQVDCGDLLRRQKPPLAAVLGTRSRVALREAAGGPGGSSWYAWTEQA